MANANAAWGIEIGAFAIKALRLERDGDSVRVSDFSVIPHKKVLTTPDLDQDEMIRLGLGQFISQKSLQGEHLVMSVPGQAAFARFAKLPPGVEPKRIPDIVKFEAVQQIPFPIEEVEWDYQTFHWPDSPETEVGIFAITRERVMQRLGLYEELSISPERLTLSPVAVFNAMHFDLDLSRESGPVMLLDIGTEATDVIIAEEGRCWIRTFPTGGTHFTEAIASAFKLSYSKAEKLKLEAATSKYTKQIMQAMRPVFSDLLQDLQRSMGFYQQTHADVEISRIIGLGSTFKIPGLRKFIGQQLQVDIVRLDEYHKIAVAGREAAAFAEHAVNFSTAYGLALQGIGMAEIDANLVPVATLREQMWHQKTKWFAAAAAVAIVGAGLSMIGPVVESQALGDGSVPQSVQNLLTTGKQLTGELSAIEAESNMGATVDNMMSLLDSRDVWPHVLRDAATALSAADPQPELLAPNVTEIMSIPADRRRLVQLRELDGDYAVDGERRLINVTMEVELSHRDPDRFLNGTVVQWLRDNVERPGVPYRIIPTSIALNQELSQEITVTEQGERARGGQGAGGDEGGHPRQRPGGGGAIGGSGDGPEMTPSGSGGGLRRGPADPDRRRRPAPGGPGGGALGGGPSGGGGASPPRPTTPAGGDRTPSWKPDESDPLDLSRDPGAGEARDIQYDDLPSQAPLPEMPRLYRPGERYYRYPITFQVELIEPDAGVGASASSGQREDTAS